jgi:uncharacterized protein
MLTTLFTSKARVKLLELLMFNSDKSYHLRELGRLIGVSPVYLSKELAGLKSLGLVSMEKMANLHLFSINAECVFLSDLKNLFLKTDFLGTALAVELIDKVKYALIFGSFAASLETSSSDVDLFVVSEIKEDELIKIVQKFEKLVKREINYILWNEKTFNLRKNNHHLLKSIKKNKTLMLVGDEKELKKQIK